MIRTYAAIAVILTVLAAFFYVFHLGVTRQKEKQFRLEMKAYQEQAEKAARVAENLESELKKQRQKMEKLQEELNDETTKPVYSQCRVPSDGVRLLQKAIAGSSAR